MAANKNSITLRYLTIAGLIAVVMISVLAKAGVIIFKEGEEWRRLVKTLRKEDLNIPPKRGNILSVDGRIMSSSVPNYLLLIDSKAGGFKDTLLTAHIDSLSFLLSRKLGDRTQAGYKSHLRAIYAGKAGNKRNVPLSSRRISHSDLKEIRKYPFFRLGATKSGLIAEQRMQRTKSFGSLASRTIGDIFQDMEKGGKNGLELSYDSLLRGTPGVYTRRKTGNRWVSSTEVEPVDGCDIRTTIDIEIQDMAEQTLLTKLKEIDAQSGTFVLMETKTGEIKAMTNLGRVAPGVYAESVNHAVADELEPGSTFKVASLIAALETGTVLPTDTFDCMGGVWKIGPSYPPINDHNKHKGGYKRLSVEEIIWNSSNIGTAKFTLKAFGNHPEQFVDALYDMKLNEPMELEIPGAGRPKIKHPIKNSGTWSKTSLPWMSFGYELQIPPIYTLTFYNAIANDGKMIKPILVKEISKDNDRLKQMETSTIKSKICSSKTLNMVQNILRGVVVNGTATAVNSEVVAIAGKTGTALVSQGRGGYKAEGKSYQVSFCGYFPADDPQYTGIVVIRKPRIGYPSGGTMSGAVLRSVAEQIVAQNQRKEAEEPEEKKYAMHPVTKGGRQDHLERVMDKLDVEYREDEVDSEWIKTKTDDQGVLLASIAAKEKQTPNVVGLGARDATFLLEGLGYRVNVVGRGRVVRQSISPGSTISRGQTITLSLD